MLNESLFVLEKQNLKDLLKSIQNIEIFDKHNK